MSSTDAFEWQEGDDGWPHKHKLILSHRNYKPGIVRPRTSFLFECTECGRSFDIHERHFFDWRVVNKRTYIRETYLALSILREPRVRGTENAETAALRAESRVHYVNYVSDFPKVSRWQRFKWWLGCDE